jgi:dTMP kinase
VTNGFENIDRTTPTGKMIDSYLKGESQLDDHAIHLHFSANRWEAAYVTPHVQARGALLTAYKSSKIKSAITSGTDVVIDRYYYSGVVYSAAKDIAGLTLEWASWPEIGLPRCDICLFLSISVEEAQKRGDFGSEKYELKEIQNQVRVLFEELVKNNPEEFVVIDAGKDAQEVEGCIQEEVAACLKRVADGGALREVTMKQFQRTPHISPD